MKKLILKQYDILKKQLHSLPQNKGKELSHINGRVGCFLACRLLIEMQSKIDHEMEHRDHNLRTVNMDLIREITIFWSKRFGCMKMHREECLNCLLLNKDLKEQLKLEKSVIEQFFSHF